MNVIEIKDKFEAIKANSTYLRVNEQHPLELYLRQKGYSFRRRDTGIDWRIALSA